METIFFSIVWMIGLVLVGGLLNALVESVIGDPEKEAKKREEREQEIQRRMRTGGHDAIHRDAQGRLHNETGPAVHYPDGIYYFYWHGVRVPLDVIMRPDRLTAHHVLNEPNAEVRRVMVERMGMERFVRESRAKTLDQDIDGAGQPRQLLRIRLWGDEPIVVVQVTDPSTGRQYHLRVPPDTRRCDEAVAWTFGVKTEEYAPIVER